MNDKSNKNQNENFKPQDNSNSSDKFSDLEDKFHRQLKETEDKLDREFEEELNKNFNTDTDKISKTISVENIEPVPTFKNSYTEKLDVASKKREDALKKGSNKYIKYSSIGMEMIGSVILGGFGGNWLDKKLEFSFPFFTITLILLGLTATFAHLIMQLNTDRKAEEEQAKRSKK
ncbi:AtpZ/AtpI family protein [Bernardetia sp. MNP-M8]|uniref:AtpZ/AtpI family protein n=1 Tax=Bernardetia sp. MNP-M8 TaxID=3127470 RepID=UPI0030D46DBC